METQTRIGFATLMGFQLAMLDYIAQNYPEDFETMEFISVDVVGNAFGLTAKQLRDTLLLACDSYNEAVGGQSVNKSRDSDDIDF